MIPNLQPPPTNVPTGWSPNGLAANIANTTLDFEAAYEALRLALTPGFVYTASVQVTKAEFLAINTTPKTIIAAPGADLLIVPLYWKVQYSGGNPAAFAVGSSLFFRYIGFPATGISDTGGMGEINNNRRSSTVFPMLPYALGVVAPGVPTVNAGIEMTAAANFTDNGGVVNSCQVSMSYLLLSTPIP